MFPAVAQSKLLVCNGDNIADRGDYVATAKVRYCSAQFDNLYRRVKIEFVHVGDAWLCARFNSARWLSAVEGLDRHTIVIYLFVMAAGLAPSALLLGIGVHHLRRRGISLTSMFGFVTALGMCAQLALILRLPLSPLLSWLLIASKGTVTVLSFTLLGQMFAASGRANAALNLLHLSTAFLVLEFDSGAVAMRYEPRR